MLGPLLKAAAGSPIPALLTTTTVQAVSAATRGVRDGHEWPTVSWGLERVVSAIANLESWSNNEVLEEPPATSPVIPNLYGEPVGTWSETRSRALLSDHGVPVVPAVQAGEPEGAESVMKDQEGPFALKIVSDDIPHKSDVGGVLLNVPRTEIESAIRSMLDDVAEASPTARIDGIMISPMRTGGVELLVGVVRDPEWGCVLAIAMGGIWTEVLNDVQRLALPTTPAKIRLALESLRSAPLLHGARGTRPVEIEALTAVIASIADVAVALGDKLAALEVNPLRADGNVIEALDAMVVWTEEAHR
jgi:succinyl-CoA synthetase beta subunit